MNTNKGTFTYWLRRDRYTIILTIVCALVSFIGPVLNQADIILELKGYPLVYLLIQRSPLIANIFFIFITLVALTRVDFLLRGDSMKSNYLYQYAKSTFGSNCELCRYGAETLFHRMQICVEQFYFSWLFVWGIWLVMYISRFIYALYGTCIYSCNEVSSRIFCFIENELNLLNSFTFFFIYMIITVSTVDFRTPSVSRKTIHGGIVILILCASMLFLSDCFSFSLTRSEGYNLVQFILRTFISIIATLSLSLVIGRLNSSFLNIPQWLFFCLYLYAATQMLYPLANIKELLVDFATPVRSLLLPVIDAINTLVMITAFGGKICLFLLIRWIAKKKRFLFFMMQKTHSMSEAETMQRTFYKVYEGCPDKEN